MAWQVMVPSPGGRRAEEIVTLACRDNSHGQGRHYNWVMTISQALRKRLGWPERSLVLVEVNPEAGLARLTPTQDKSAGWRLTINKTALQGILPLPTAGTGLIPATRIPYRIENGSLILTLPTWAGGFHNVEPAAKRAPRGRGAQAKKPEPPAPIKVAPPPQPKPADQTPWEKEDIREALGMIAAGDNNAKIMEYFGWSFQRVESLRRSAAALRRAA